MTLIPYYPQVRLSELGFFTPLADLAGLLLPYFCWALAGLTVVLPIGEAESKSRDIVVGFSKQLLWKVMIIFRRCMIAECGFQCSHLLNSFSKIIDSITVIIDFPQPCYRLPYPKLSLLHSHYLLLHQVLIQKTCWLNFSLLCPTTKVTCG